MDAVQEEGRRRIREVEVVGVLLAARASVLAGAAGLAGWMSQRPYWHWAGSLKHFATELPQRHRLSSCKGARARGRG